MAQNYKLVPKKYNKPQSTYIIVPKFHHTFAFWKQDMFYEGQSIGN